MGYAGGQLTRGLRKDWTDALRKRADAGPMRGTITRGRFRLMQADAMAYEVFSECGTGVSDANGALDWLSAWSMERGDCQCSVSHD